MEKPVLKMYWWRGGVIAVLILFIWAIFSSQQFSEWYVALYSPAFFVVGALVGWLYGKSKS